MMNVSVSPEELQRLQILNNYIAQTIDAAQRVAPYLQAQHLQQRGLWGAIPQQAGFGAAPWQSLQALGTLGQVAQSGLFHTPFQTAGIGAPFNPLAAYGAFAPMGGINVPGAMGFGGVGMGWGVPTGLLHSPFVPAMTPGVSTLEQQYAGGFFPGTGLPVFPVTSYGHGLLHTPVQPGIGRVPGIESLLGTTAPYGINPIIEAFRADAYRRALLGLPLNPQLGF